MLGDRVAIAKGQLNRAVALPELRMLENLQVWVIETRILLVHLAEGLYTQGNTSTSANCLAKLTFTNDIYIPQGCSLT